MKTTTTFAGLQLKNPFVVASSGLTDNPQKVQKLALAGAGAVVLKSLYEEQILNEAHHMADEQDQYGSNEYMAEYLRAHRIGEYLNVISESKKLVDIPVIASIACFNQEGWTDFATQVEQAGADAIEVNVMAHQTDVNYTYGSFEQRHIDILRAVRKATKLPVIMKLGDNLTNPVALAAQLQANGAAAVVLFNRFYQPDIDINKIEQTSANVFSNQSDLCNTLRWVGITSAKVRNLDIIASGGIHTAEDMVKVILAGAPAAEICSALYSKGEGFIAESLNCLENWMEKNGFESIADFRGRLNLKNNDDTSTFERTQFMRYFASGKK